MIAQARNPKGGHLKIRIFMYSKGSQKSSQVGGESYYPGLANASRSLRETGALLEGPRGPLRQNIYGGQKMVDDIHGQGEFIGVMCLGFVGGFIPEAT